MCSKFFIIISFIHLIPVSFGSHFIHEKAAFNVPFGAGYLNVFEHKAGHYYVSPITGLLPKTAVCKQNIITGETELRFDIIMWSTEARNAVYTYIKSDENPLVKKSHVQPLPMERIRLVWRDKETHLQDVYRLSQTWKINSRLPSQVTFLFLCQNFESCEKLKNFMKKDSEVLDGLELQYVMKSQPSKRKLVKIYSSHFWESSFHAKLIKEKVEYIKSGDMDKIVTEIVSSVIKSIDDAEIEIEDSTKVKEAVKSLLGRKISTDYFTSAMWNFTYWDPIAERPDVLVKKLNTIFSKDKNDANFLIINNIESPTLKLLKQNLLENGKRVSVAKIIEKIQENQWKIKWNGQNFTSKAFELYRLSTAIRKDAKEYLTSASVQLRHYDTVRHMSVNVKPIGKQTITLSSTLPDSITTKFINEFKSISNSLNDNMKRLDEQFREMASKDANKCIHYKNQTYCLRLVNGERNSIKYSGRVELVVDGVMGTLCDDKWTDKAAKVICRMLGYTGKAVAKTQSYYGWGSGKIFMDEVQCTGEEDTILNCRHKGWSVHDCSHREDAGVECYR